MEENREALMHKKEALRRVQQALDNEKHPSFRKFNVVEHGINCKDENGGTALHIAAMCKAINCIKLLLENGAHVDVQNKQGATPLYLTSMGSPDYHIYEAFIEYGADPYLKDYVFDLNPAFFVEFFHKDKPELFEKFKKITSKNTKPGSR